jgi:hypothetical protein
LFPFLDEGGTIEWPRAMKMLNGAPDQYPLLLELRDAPDVQQPIERAREVFERLENLRTDE